MKSVNGLEEFNQEVFNTDKVVLIDFWASWCEPCKEMLPIIEELSHEYKDINFVSVKVDDNREIARIFKVMSVPSILIVKNNDVQEFVPGFQSKENIEKLIANYIA